MRTNSIWLKLLIVVLAPALLLAVARPANAGTTFYYVNGCGDDDWTGLKPTCVGPDGPKATIQAAISDPLTLNGDVIIVAPGTYRELIDFLGKSVKLRSSDGPELTIINGDLDEDPKTPDGTVVTCESGEGSNSVLDGFTITGGQIVGSGGGMRNDPGSPTVTNCIFRFNTSLATGGVSGGGGMFNGPDSNPTVTNCSFELNTADNTGGGMFNWDSSPAVIDCSFSNNSAGAGGGMGNRFSARPTVINCTFTNNTAFLGGGMYNADNGSPTVTNCIFRSNHAIGDGGGMYNSDGVPTVANCTFFQNTAFAEGGAIWGGIGTFANCIVWDNSDPGGIFGSPTVTFSDVSGGFPGPGNINSDPLFVDPDNHDFHLSGGSPCIDAAENAAVPLDELDLDGDFIFDEPIPFDLDGKPRFVNDLDTPDCQQEPGKCGELPVVDMGAYEFQAITCPWDLDGSADVGILDLLALLAAWGSNPGHPADFNNDGTVGILDLLTLLANWGPCP